MKFPLYRAKKKNKEESVKGYLFKDDCGDFRITDGTKNHNHPFKKPFEWLVDTSSVEISFDNENWYSVEEAHRRINASYLAETICENNSVQNMQ